MRLSRKKMSITNAAVKCETSNLSKEVKCKCMTKVQMNCNSVA